MTKRINNAAELEAETYRLKLEQQKLLKGIRHDWKEVKEQGTPALLATEAAIKVITGNSAAGNMVVTATEILLDYFRKK